MTTVLVPDFDFSGFYYPQLVESLLQYKRSNVPEISTESPFDPGIQCLRSFALIGHLNNTLLDMVANETLIATARLRESVVGHLALIGFTPSADIPAKAVLRAALTKSFVASTLVVPILSLFGTRRKSSAPAIFYEADESLTINPTDAWTVLLRLIRPAGVETWGADLTTEVNTDAMTFALFAPFGSTADSEFATFIIGHKNVMVDTLEFTGKTGSTDFGDDRTATPVIVVWEYFDGTVEDAEPDSVTNLGFTLKFVVDGLLGTSDDRRGQKCTVTVNATGATEELDVDWDGVNNFITTTGFLSQTTPSTDESDYSVGCKWKEITGITDTTLAALLEPAEAFDTGDGSTQSFTQTVIRWPLDSGTVVQWDYTEEGTGNPLQATYELDDDGLPVLGGDAGSGTTVDYDTGTMTLNTVLVPENVQPITVTYRRKKQPFQQDGSVSFKVPKTITDDWNEGDLSEEMVFVAGSGPSTDRLYLRSRIVSHGLNPGATGPVFDRILMDSGGLFVAFDVTQGRTTTTEAIGSGTGEPDQQFTLDNSPVIQESVEVFVDGDPATVVNDFASSTSADLHAVVTIDSDGIATVTFGDGINGQTVSVGTNNVTSTYRTEANIDGNVGADQVVVNRSGLSRVKNITNPRPAQFWLQQEGATESTLEKLKRDGIASLRTLDRAVSPPDIQYLATQFTDPDTLQKPFSRARAIENGYGPKTIKLVVVPVGGGSSTPALRVRLDEFYNGDIVGSVEGVLVINHQVTSIDFTAVPIDITATITGGNLESIETAIQGLVNPEAKLDDGLTFRWNFGQDVDPSIIISTIVEADKENITAVALTLPAAPVLLVDEELPTLGTLLLTVN